MRSFKIVLLLVTGIILIFMGCFENPFGNEILLPSGKNLTLYVNEGYNFDMEKKVTGEKDADIILKKEGNTLYIGRWIGNNIYYMEGYGAGHSLDEIKIAPDPKYVSYNSYLQPQDEQIYCLITQNGCYAKIKITDVTSDTITFDWVYQPDGSRNFYIPYGKDEK